MVDQVTTRRIRIVKYRGTTHGTNEYPFLIEKDGISIWPITSVQLEHTASHERIPTGIERLDTMLGGKGFYRGSSILLSGTAGTGKTSVATTFAEATCRRGERCLYISFEESPSQIMRNMATIGIDLQQWVRKGRLQFQNVRPFHFGLEMHLARTIKFITEFAPEVVIIDPISGLDTSGTSLEVKAALMRLVDYLKQQGITAMLTDLKMGGAALERTDAAISSLVDTWLVLHDLESNGERNRGLHVLKSRGMGHSNQVREFTLSQTGIQLTDVYIGPSGMLTGSARVAQEARERAEHVSLDEEAERQQLALECKRAALEGQIAALSAFVGLSDRAGFAALLEAARMGGSAAEITLSAGDQSEVPLQLALSPLPAEFAAAICLVATDISESRKREKAKDIRSEEEIRELNAGLEQRVIERTVQLEVAVKEIAAFSYTVSHDLRAPIRAMSGYSNILLEDYGEKVDEEGRRVLKIIRSEAKRMGDLVDDLLAFSRLSRQPMVSVDVDMEALANSVFESLAALERDRELQLTLRPLPIIKGELAMLRQVWVNLLSNAVKFTKGREVAEIEIGAENGAGEQIYYVKDNGAGFDMRFVGKLFGVFQRLHTDQEFPGTGVGLAIVQRVITRHGGRVWAEGKINEGVTIYFAIPKTKI